MVVRATGAAAYQPEEWEVYRAECSFHQQHVQRTLHIMQQISRELHGEWQTYTAEAAVAGAAQHLSRSPEASRTVVRRRALAKNAVQQQPAPEATTIVGDIFDDAMRPGAGRRGVGEGWTRGRQGCSAGTAAGPAAHLSSRPARAATCKPLMPTLAARQWVRRSLGCGRRSPAANSSHPNHRQRRLPLTQPALPCSRRPLTHRRGLPPGGGGRAVQARPLHGAVPAGPGPLRHRVDGARLHDAAAAGHEGAARRGLLGPQAGPAGMGCGRGRALAACR